MDDSFDVAFLQEVSAFLHASEPLGSSTVAANLDTNCDPSASSHTKTDDATLKRKRQHEKKESRKQRYERRLKEERQTLRKMEKLLTVQLVNIKKARDNKMVAQQSQISTVIQDLAQWERRQRRQSEEEQKKLVEALTIQASYLATLQELLPEPTKVLVMNTVHANTFTYQTEKQLAPDRCGC